MSFGVHYFVVVRGRSFPLYFLVAGRWFVFRQVLVSRRGRGGGGVAVRRPSLGSRGGRRCPPVRAARRIVGEAVIGLFKYKQTVSTRVRHGGDGLSFTLRAYPRRTSVVEVRGAMGRMLQEGLPIAVRFVSRRRTVKHFSVGHLPRGTSRAMQVMGINSCSRYLYVNRRIGGASRVNAFGVVDRSCGSKVFHVQFGLV